MKKIVALGVVILFSIPAAAFGNCVKRVSGINPLTKYFRGPVSYEASGRRRIGERYVPMPQYNMRIQWEAFNVLHKKGSLDTLEGRALVTIADKSYPRTTWITSGSAPVHTYSFRSTINGPNGEPLYSLQLDLPEDIDRRDQNLRGGFLIDHRLPVNWGFRVLNFSTN